MRVEAMDNQKSSSSETFQIIRDMELKTRIESMIYSRDDRKYIQLGNYALDFKKEYLYLGITKSGNVILGDERYNGIKKFFGKIYDNKIHAEGSRFIEEIPKIEEIKRGIVA